MIEPGTAWIALRALIFGAAAFLFGTSSLLALYWSPLAHDLSGRLRRPLRYASAVLFAATAVSLPLLAATAGDGWGDAFDFEFVTGVALSTRSGAVGLARLVIAALITWLTVMPSRAPPISTRSLSLACALYIASFAFTGHAVMHDGILALAHQANHMAHVLAGSFWVGALIPLLMAVRLLGSRAQAAPAVRLLTQFSHAGLVSVTVIAISGALNTVLILGKMPADLTSWYQRLLVAKIAIVAFMLTLALANRLWLVPRARARKGAGLLKASIGAETIAGMLVILLVAVFGTMEPV